MTEFQKRIDSSGLEPEFIAKQLGLSTRSFEKKCDDVSQFKPSEINRLCKLLNIDSLEDRYNTFFAWRKNR